MDSTLRIQGATYSVITHTRQVFDAATADQNHGVFLQVVTLTADVRNDLKAIRQTNLANLTESGDRLFRGSGINTSANATLLRALFQSRNLALGLFRDARLAHELVDGRHIKLPSTAGHQKNGARRQFCYPEQRQ